MSERTAPSRRPLATFTPHRGGAATREVAATLVLGLWAANSSGTRLTGIRRPGTGRKSSGLEDESEQLRLLPW